MSGVRCPMPCVTCHLSGVMCQVSRVTCHLSLTPTATATDPSPANSPTLCTAGWFLRSQKSTFSRIAILNHILAKITNSVTPYLSSIFCRESFCNWSSCPRTFVNGSNKTFKKYTCNGTTYMPRTLRLIDWIGLRANSECCDLFVNQVNEWVTPFLPWLFGAAKPKWLEIMHPVI